MFNKLLENQILKFFKNVDDLPGDYLELLKEINQFYNLKEKEHNAMLHAINISNAFINSSKDLMWSIDKKSTLITANQAFINTIKLLTGATFKPGDNMKILSGIPIDHLKKWETYYIKAFKGEALTIEEYNNDYGVESWAEISMQPIFENNEVIGASCFSRDITENKRAIKIIKQSEETMAYAQRIAHFGSWEMSLVESEHNPLNTLTWSDEVYRIFGYEPGKYNATLKNYFSAVHPNDLELVTAAIEKALKENSTYGIEHRIILPNGDIRWLKESATILLDDNTMAPLKMIGTVEDITERKKAELEQKQAEDNIRNILENTDTAYVLMNKNATILSFNQLAKELAHQLAGKAIKENNNYIDLMPEYRKQDVKLKIDSVIARNQKITYETMFLDRNGKEQWLFVSINPILNQDHELISLSIAARNITDRKLFEIERSKIANDITQRNKDLEQFTYIVSHNLRAPVASILGLSVLLETPGIDEATKAECIKGFVSSVKNLDNTIIDLNYILQARKEIHEKKDLVKFLDTVKSIEESIGNLITKENVKIHTDFSQINEMYTLKSYLYSIFYNLISNSIKYRKPNNTPIIQITSKRIDKKIILVFSDNGIGIDLKAHGDKIFGLYKRFHLDVEGKGMGLYMVKTQVETLGGKVFITSEVNKGTDFTLEFET